MENLKAFLYDEDFDESEINMIIDHLSKIPVSELLKNNFEEDGILLGWHSNIACWIMDNLGIVDYNLRNKLAQRFIKRFFDVDYDWMKLLNPNNRTYSADKR